MPGWLVASEGKLTVALDVTVSDELRREGYARELVNRIQNIRKESGFEVTDRITVEIEDKEYLRGAIACFGDFVASQTLSSSIKLSAAPQGDFVVESDIDDDPVKIAVTKI